MMGYIQGYWDVQYPRQPFDIQYIGLCVGHIIVTIARSVHFSTPGKFEHFYIPAL